MNTSGEVADLMVKETLEITEWAAKLAGLGAKNLAAIIVALLKEENKTHGATTLKNLLKSEKPLCILQIKESDIKRFKSEAKKYGVLFTAIADKVNGSGFCDIIARQDDITQLNYILERMGYNDPDYLKLNEDKSGNKAEEKSEDINEEYDRKLDLFEESEELHEKSEDDNSKKSEPHAEQENESRSEKKYTARGEKDDKKKPSVKERIEKIKQERKGKPDKAPKHERKKQKSSKPKQKSR